MKSGLFASFITLLALLVTITSGRVIKNDLAKPSSESAQNSSLFNVSSVSNGLPGDAPADFLDDFNPATGGDFDPNVWADDELWNKYLAKGQRLMCLMDATDQGAGYLMQDTRQPPSAASRWTSDLVGKLTPFSPPTLATSSTDILPQLNSKHGTGTRSPSTRTGIATSRPKVSLPCSRPSVSTLIPPTTTTVNRQMARTSAMWFLMPNSGVASRFEIKGTMSMAENTGYVCIYPTELLANNHARLLAPHTTLLSTKRTGSSSR